MVEVFDLHQAEHKTIHCPAKIADFCGCNGAGWSSGSSSGS